MKTPQEVGMFRLKIIANMLAGKIGKDAAVDLQRMTDGEILALVRRDMRNGHERD